MINKITPEAAGVSSREVLRFIKTFDDYNIPLHSIIMSRGDDIYAECYYAPFNESFKHRMYSVSKSFIAMAVGVAVTEGLISLDDIVSDYFPEFKNENFDELNRECTVRDMLKMKSNIGTGVMWWGKYKSRVEAYYSMKSSKIPDTLFMYDSIGCFLLGCIIEKLTGKTFLEYLKEKVLLDIGFSPESFTLYEPGGYTVGDSGVVCTARDLWLFARFIMKNGEWGGKQYIDRQFMLDAISYQSYSGIGSRYEDPMARGYGYLIWKTHKDGFSLIGMGDQLAICDLKRDLCLVITADNQDSTEARSLIFHEFYNHFINNVNNAPLPTNDECLMDLTEYLASRTLACVRGESATTLASKINGVKYNASENALGVVSFTLNFTDGDGTLNIEFKDKNALFNFGIGKNKLAKFSYGTRARADMMGVYEDGAYNCAISGAWVDECTFAVRAQVIDTYFGSACAYLSFKDKRATLALSRNGQYVFDGMCGYVTAKSEL